MAFQFVETRKILTWSHATWTLSESWKHKKSFENEDVLNWSIGRQKNNYRYTKKKNLLRRKQIRSAYRSRVDRRLLGEHVQGVGDIQGQTLLRFQSLQITSLGRLQTNRNRQYFRQAFSKILYFSVKYEFQWVWKPKQSHYYRRTIGLGRATNEDKSIWFFGLVLLLWHGLTIGTRTLIN